MSTKIKKVGVLTSGGDSPGMNAAIRAVVRACAYYNVECVGIYRGYQGMIEGDFKEMGPRDVKNIINKGGTILKSARSADFRTAEGRKKAHDNLVAAGIDSFVVIGGDGSFTGEFVGSHQAPPGSELVDPFGWDRVGLDESFDGLGCFFPDPRCRRT